MKFGNLLDSDSLSTTDGMLSTTEVHMGVNSVSYSFITTCMDGRKRNHQANNMARSNLYKVAVVWYPGRSLSFQK